MKRAWLLFGRRSWKRLWPGLGLLIDPDHVPVKDKDLDLLSWDSWIKLSPIRNVANMKNNGLTRRGSGPEQMQWCRVAGRMPSRFPGSQCSPQLGIGSRQPGKEKTISLDKKQDVLHVIHLRFVHDSDEPAVDVDDDVSLANAALVRVGLLLHAAENKVKTKLVAEIIQMSFLSLSSLKSTFHINQLYTLTFTFTFLNFHFTLLLGVVHILRNCG